MRLACPSPRPLVRRLAAAAGGLAALALVGAPSARGQAAAFLRLGFDARSVGLGRATLADVSGNVSPFDNPALAPFLEGQHLDVSASLLSQDRQLQSVQVGTALRPRAGAAGGVLRAATTGIDGRDASGQPTGTFDVEETATFVAFGLRPTARTSAGVAIQIFRADLGDLVRPALSIGLDVGVLLRPTDRLTVGFVADDLLAGYAFEQAPNQQASSAKDRFPTRLRAGAGYVRGRVRLVGEAEAAFVNRERRTASDVLEGSTPRETSTTTGYTLASGTLRGGAEVTLARGVEARVGLDGLGNARDGLRPSAGASFTQDAGPLRLRAHYAAALDPFGNGLRHAVGLRVVFL